MMDLDPSAPKRDTRGFTIVEVLIVLAVVALMAIIAIPRIGSTVNAVRLDNGVDFVTMQFRRARQSAVDHRRIYRLTLNQRDLLVEKLDPVWTQVQSIDLPREIEFGVPAPSPASSPDGYGYSGAVNFAGANQIWFHPDGSARDGVGNYRSGIVYIRRSDDPSQGAALTLFGATGRIKPWRLHGTDQGGKIWK